MVSHQVETNTNTIALVTKLSPVLHTKLAKYDIIQSKLFVHAIFKNIIVDMKWFDPSLRDGNYFQLKYLSIPITFNPYDPSS